MKRNRIKRALVWIVAGCFLLTGCSFAGGDGTAKGNTEVFVSAAVSLKDALTDIQKRYEQEHPNLKLQYNFGGSGALQMQIEQGAPADIFLSAGKKQMDALETKNLIVADTLTKIVGNKLVLVVPSKRINVKTPEDLAKKEILKIAIGSPSSVPAGSYAKEALEHYGLWPVVQSKLVFTEDVSQVLRYVETENVDAGIVYQSDAHSSDKVEVVFTFPEESHSPIEYPAALLVSGQGKKEAQDFLQYLKSAEAQEIFAKYGFSKP